MARHPALERRIGHRFKDPALLAQALTHRSFGTPNYERLEFLGDGVLGCVVSEVLYDRFPNLPEGKLHLLKVSLVRETALAEVARGIGLSEFLKLGAGEAGNLGAGRDSILADTLEAIYGAVFLDGGYAAVQQAVRMTFGERLAQVDPEKSAKDAKTHLQELLQGRRKELPEYRLVSTAGEAPRQVFEVECVAAGLGLRATGSGSSRRLAEQQAAANLLKQIGS